jgi:putative ABC transport system substrate-binding protein
VPGQTIRIEYLSAQSRGESFPKLAEECVRGKADIIATTTTPAAQAAKAATGSIPIVMLITGDPIGAGLVASLAKPGGNVTGQSFQAGDLAAKRLEILKETIPGLSRVLVLTYPLDPISPTQIKALQSAGEKLGVKLHIREVRTAADIEPAFQAGLKEAPQAILLTSESLFVANRQRVIELIGRHRLPGVFPYPDYARGGGLMSYAHEPSDLHRRAALQVERILKGAKPADLPVEQPTTFNLVINMKTARALGVSVPHSLLLRAVEVIE